MVKVTDSESLKAWLVGQSPEVIRVLVIRNALRSLAHLFSVRILGGPDHYNPNLGLFRQFIIASVSMKSKKSLAFSEMVSCEYSTNAKNSSDILSFLSHVTGTRNSSSRIAEEMDDSIEFVASDVFATKDMFSLPNVFADDPFIVEGFWEDIGADVADFAAGKKASTIRAAPLWRSNNPIDHLWERKKNELQSHPEDWSFWIDWYQRILDGHPQNWEMLEEIALIDPEDWDKGAEHVNGLISGIQARYLHKATPYSEKIEINPETGKLRSVPNPMENERLYQTALDRVRDALDDLRPDGELAQHHAGLEKVAKRLDRTLGSYAENPQRVHDDFLLSAKQITSLVESTEVAKDEDVDALQSSLVTGADDIRAADAVVKASVAARVALRLEELRVEDTEVIAEAVDMLAVESEGELKGSFEDDASSYREILVNWPGGDALPLGGANYEESVHRLFRTAAQTSRIIPVLKAGNGFVLSAATSYSVTDMLIKLGDLVTILIKLFV